MFVPTAIATTHNSNCKLLMITAIGTVTSGANSGLKLFITCVDVQAHPPRDEVGRSALLAHFFNHSFVFVVSTNPNPNEVFSVLDGKSPVIDIDTN